MSTSYRLPSNRSTAVMSRWKRDSKRVEAVAESAEDRHARLDALKQRIREADAKAGRKPWKGTI
ncbi:MAG: hypothetical protein EOP83_17710 [Verrucomicrobiaceae bacterium]|nr:MAG: hypothetical protein EOP83_17710 [Verrucomicrobiaceae bacterium]